MKILIAAVLSAVLIALPTQQVNNPVQQAKPTQMSKAAREVQQVEPEPQKQQVATVPESSQPKVIKTEVAQPLTDKQRLMQQAGIPEQDWSAVDYIVSHESSWRFQATNTDSGAYGLCQALPASKMASAGEDYRTNPVTQLKWCHSYALTRYGGWWKAFAFWQASRWW